MKNVEFISYTGKYPNLCNGILTLKINNSEVKFGNDYHTNEHYSDCFWHSGGTCGFHGYYEGSYRESGRWLINESEIPEEYREYTDDIEELFNDNVEYGCCGGCL